MGITANELAKLYPRLYHMAHRDSWASIQKTRSSKHERALRPV
jgi:hypothetical protein